MIEILQREKVSILTVLLPDPVGPITLGRTQLSANILGKEGIVLLTGQPCRLGIPADSKLSPLEVAFARHLCQKDCRWRAI